MRGLMADRKVQFLNEHPLHRWWVFTADLLIARIQQFTILEISCLRGDILVSIISTKFDKIKCSPHSNFE